MVTYKELFTNDSRKLETIDRSETIDYIYQLRDGKLLEIESHHECPSWDSESMEELKERFVYELSHRGKAFGAFDQEHLVGFGVLAHQFRGAGKDQLQVDLMYVSRAYRRKGIGTNLMNQLSDAARKRGAKFLYISSTETRSAVFFYKNSGSQLADEVDQELFEKEPNDIHMIIEL